MLGLLLNGRFFANVVDVVVVGRSDCGYVDDNSIVFGVVVLV